MNSVLKEHYFNGLIFHVIKKSYWLSSWYNMLKSISLFINGALVAIDSLWMMKDKIFKSYWFQITDFYGRNMLDQSFS